MSRANGRNESKGHKKSPESQGRVRSGQVRSGQGQGNPEVGERPTRKSEVDENVFGQSNVEAKRRRCAEEVSKRARGGSRQNLKISKSDQATAPSRAVTERCQRWPPRLRVHKALAGQPYISYLASLRRFDIEFHPTEQTY